MAVNINSQEFANAWRIVSEALLARLQSGASYPINEVVSTIVAEASDLAATAPATPAAQAPRVEAPAQQAPAAPGRSKTDERYVNCAVRQRDNTYRFKNLKYEIQESTLYKITRYSDGTCEFELCLNHDDARMVFKDNTQPETVVVSTGELTGESAVNTISVGLGHMDGETVVIDRPLRVEFV